ARFADFPSATPLQLRRSFRSARRSRPDNSLIGPWIKRSDSTFAVLLWPLRTPNWEKMRKRWNRYSWLPAAVNLNPMDRGDPRLNRYEAIRGFRSLSAASEFHEVKCSTGCRVWPVEAG